MSEALLSLRSNQANYRPRAAVLDILAAKNIRLHLLAGVCGVGKGGLIRAAVNLDGDLSMGRAKTTRPPRYKEGEGQYDFSENFEKNVTKLAAQARNGDLVQYVVAPFNNHIYASNLKHYPKGKVVMDVLAEAMPQFDDLPLEALSKFGVAAMPKEWERLSRGRFRQHSKQEMGGRILEGIQAYSMMLEAGNEITWLRAHMGKPYIGAQEFVDFANGTGEPDADNRLVAEQLLAHLVSFDVSARYARPLATD